MTTGGYEEVASSYDEGYAGPYWEIYDAITWATADAILPPRGGHVLDAGAGTGKFALEFLRRGFDVTLLDPSAAMLERARAKIEAAGLLARARFLVGGIGKIGLPDASVDAVFCEGDPLSYVRDAAPVAAREILRVLRPGGGFYVSCDSRYFTSVLLFAGDDIDGALQVASSGETQDRYGIPVHAFTPAELRALFADAGAQHVKVTGKVVLTGFPSAKALEAALRDPRVGPRVLALELEASRNEDLAGLGGHLQVVGRKRS